MAYCQLPYRALSPHMIQMRFPIFHQVKITIDLISEERHNDLGSYHKNPNPATIAPHLLWLWTVSQFGWPWEEGLSLVQIEEHKHEQAQLNWSDNYKSMIKYSKLGFHNQ